MNAVRALYATNVYHYDHVLLAMQATFGATGLVRRFELTEKELDKLRRLGLPGLLLGPIARRVREPAQSPHAAHTLGPGQLLLPVLARSNIAIQPWHIRMVTAAYAKHTAKVASDHDYFHFVEGLGYKALESRKFVFSICERRNFHHQVYENEIDVIDGFPGNAAPDPIGDVLDFEYANADCIIVYSDSARRSFLERGFPEKKVRVLPIGIGPQLPRIDLPRSDMKLLYVGRADPYKGLDVAVAAAKLLGTPFRLTVAGVMSPAVKRWLRSQPGVDYVGVLNRHELREAYSTHAALILPSVESFGLAAAEAVYHGLPLICSDKTGIAEYLPEDSTSVVVGRDPAVWAAAILDALASARLGRDDARTAEVERAMAGLSWEAAAAPLTELYSATIPKIGARGGSVAPSARRDYKRARVLRKLDF